MNVKNLIHYYRYLINVQQQLVEDYVNRDYYIQY